MRLIPSISTRLEDEDLERVRRNLDDRVTQLQGLPAAGLSVLGPITLADSTATKIAHGLGKVPRFVGVSCVRGATSTGRIVETRDGNQDLLTLTATGWGATITVDLLVLP